MPDQQEELRLTVTLADNASAGLQKLNEEIKQLGSGASQQHVEKFKRDTSELTRQIKGMTSEVSEAFKGFSMLRGGLAAGAAGLALFGFEIARQSKALVDYADKIRSLNQQARQLEQARLFEQVRSMAVSDSLTGLANYRRLIHVLETELDRSRRTMRPFSVILLDMDGLKAINDQFGHLTGSRALVRLGKVLSNHSRAIDTPARYGGDEFALVLPEASREVAARVVARIRERLAAEPERPALSVSAGVAAFPEDGDTPEQLLGAADRALYGMKNRGGSIQNLTRIAACL